MSNDQSLTTAIRKINQHNPGHPMRKLPKNHPLRKVAAATWKGELWTSKDIIAYAQKLN